MSFPCKVSGNLREIFRPFATLSSTWLLSYSTTFFFLCPAFSATLLMSFHPQSSCIWIREAFAFTLLFIVASLCPTVGSGLTHQDFLSVYLHVFFHVIKGPGQIRKRHFKVRCKGLLRVSVIMKTVGIADTTFTKCLSHKTLSGFYGAILSSV